MDSAPAESDKLVVQALGGDRTAFARLITIHERQALAVAYAVVGCAATSADVVQDAMVRAWRRLSELDDPSRFSAWLLRIVRNLAVDALRRKPRAEFGGEQLAKQPCTASQDRLELAELRERIHAALSQLDETTRIAVTLRYYQDLSSRQIGQLLGLSPEAVDMRLCRARALLRQKLASAVLQADVPADSGTSVKEGSANDRLAQTRRT
ncbi:MAG: sigma-70 family RNA polymerase sigma factor [Phycisphaerae bacterium]|nr:sigma-70 family RNA polymerase sigma factor [Phycisphaerae bacterium]MDW8261853.1 sigma-70 family RNA polymerase sigma factor [Phycisphaerales bacterium]